MSSFPSHTIFQKELGFFFLFLSLFFLSVDLGRKTPGCGVGEDGHELVDLVLLSLQDALGNPDQVSNFLLFQLDVGVEWCCVCYGGMGLMGMYVCRDGSHGYVCMYVYM